MAVQIAPRPRLRGAERDLVRERFTELKEEMLLSLLDAIQREKRRAEQVAEVESFEAHLIRQHEVGMLRLGRIKEALRTEQHFSAEQVEIACILTDQDGWNHADPVLLESAHQLVLRMIAERQADPRLRTAEREVATEGMS